MSRVPLTRPSPPPGLAESRAADVSAGRQRLDAGRDTLDRYRASQLAEEEALALARIKADTERALAHQAQTLRDAERAAELVAIERSSTDLEAIKEAQRRQALDEEAQVAKFARTTADQRAAMVALEKKSVLAAAYEARRIRLQSEREALFAKRKNWRAHIGLAWFRIKTVSPLLAGLGALLIGAGLGLLVAELHSNAPSLFGRSESSLKLETELASPPPRLTR